MLLTIYILAAFIFIFFFKDGLSRFSSKSTINNYLPLIILSIVIRIALIFIDNASISQIINCLFDLLVGLLIYVIAKSIHSSNKALLYTSFYLLNPITLIFSCTWDNISSPYIALILLMCWLIYTKKYVLAYAAFLISLAFSQQSIVFIPIFLLIGIDSTIAQKPDKKCLNNFSLVLLLTLLFVFYFTLLPNRKLAYVSGLGAYPYAAINACNFWSLLGMNWKALDTPWLFLTISQWGLFMLFAILGIILFFNHHYKKQPDRYVYLCFLALFSTYVLGIQNREQAFQSIFVILLLLIIIYETKILYHFYTGLTLIYFLNLLYTSFIYDPSHFNPKHLFLLAVSLLFVLSFIGVLILSYKVDVFKTKAENDSSSALCLDDASMLNLSTDHISTLNLSTDNTFNNKDFLYMALLTFFFAITVFTSLGNHYAPTTSLTLADEKEKGTHELVLDLGEYKTLDHLSIFLGNLHHIKVAISSYNETTQSWEIISDKEELSSVFDWNDIKLEDTTARYLGIVCLSKEAVFNELAVFDSNNQIILPVNSDEYPTLFDEQSYCPLHNTYMYGTVFDEVYHGRTAYEFIHQITTYETTHPPLGKIIISLGIRLFGMNPFGWRFMSAVFGTLLVPIFYIFGKKLFKQTYLAVCTTLFYVLDLMPHALSRISTIDIFIAFFIVLMYYFMYAYCTLTHAHAPLKKTLIPLGLSGLSMGLGVATKWTGVYAGMGLGVLFFMNFWECSLLPYLKSRKRSAKAAYKQSIIKTIGFCLVTFILIPCVIYVLSYIPFIDSAHHTNLITKAIENAKLMFSYHSTLVSTHPYASSWYKWPFMIRPLLYSFCMVSDTDVSVTNCMGNPIIWWTGAFVMLYLLNCWINKKDKKAGFICISYLAQLIPWMFVDRTTYIYHYFACCLFMFLGMGYACEKLITQTKKGKEMILIYFVIVIIAFFAFYPIINGAPINREWAIRWLRWLPTWVLC